MKLNEFLDTWYGNCSPIFILVPTDNVLLSLYAEKFSGILNKLVSQWSCRPIIYYQGNNHDEEIIKSIFPSPYHKDITKQVGDTQSLIVAKGYRLIFLFAPHLSIKSFLKKNIKRLTEFSENNFYIFFKKYDYDEDKQKKIEIERYYQQDLLAEAF